MALFAPLPDVIAGQIGEELASSLVDVYSRLEAELTAQMAERLRKGLTQYPALDEQLRTIATLREQARRLLIRMDTPGVAADLVRVAAEEGIAAAAARIGLAQYVPRPQGLAGISPAGINAISLLTLDLQNSLGEMSQRIVRGVGDDYQRVIAAMAPNLLVGATTMQQAQQQAVAQFLAKGLTGFRDRAGRNWTIGSYAEMATRTVTARAWNEAGIASMQAAGINAVTPIVGRGACQRCSAWAGKVLSTDGTPAGEHDGLHATTGATVRFRIDATIEEARAAGLHHPNCGCVDVAYMPGLPIEGDQTTYDPKLEADRQQLRALERRKRALLRQELGAGDEVTKQRFRREVRATDKAIREHVEETGLNRRRYRERLAWSDGPVGGALPPTRAIPPTTPPPPRKPAPVAPVRRAARGDIIAADKPTQVQTALELAHGGKGIRFSGLDATRLDLTKVKDWGVTVDDLLTRFPNTFVDEVAILPVKNPRHYAYAAWNLQQRIVQGKPQPALYTKPRMHTALSKMRTGSKGDETFRRDSASGWHHQVPDDVPAMRYIVTHEWGHLLDRQLSNAGFYLRKEVRDIVTEQVTALGMVPQSPAARAWLKGQVSTYGQTNTEEMVAEAFADAVINGDKAKPLSQAIHNRIIELLKKVP